MPNYFMPTFNQFKRWSLPSKLTLYGVILAIIALIYSMNSIQDPSFDKPAIDCQIELEKTTGHSFTSILDIVEKNDEKADEYLKNGISKHKRHNYEDALSDYNVAAKKMSYTAMYEAGVLYYMGLGTIRDVDKGVSLILKSAENNVHLAQDLIGIFYLNGEVIEKNIKKGLYWTKRAANNGNDNAQLRLASLYQNGSIVNKDLKESLFWYRTAAAQGNPVANLALGTFYYSGYMVNKNLDTAKDYFMISAQKKNKDAIRYLSCINNNSHKPLDR
jgi:TPR repeat protein